jgi:ribonucleoside-diphosphate reductase alpha chain
MVNHPELCEDDVLRPTDTVCVRIPVKAPEGSILRTETALDTLERVKKFATKWIVPGHLNGDNTHNVSATISIDSSKKYTSIDMSDGKGSQITLSEEGWLDEWEAVGLWMWDNREVYNGLSVLPFFGGTYKQAPFEDITEEEYNTRIASVQEIDLKNVVEIDDNVDFGQVSACSGSQCEINL